MLTLLVIQLFVALLCTEILVRCLPSAIRERIAANCRRMDGSWSARRAGVERRALTGLRGNLLFAFLLVAFPINSLLYLAHRHLMPIPIAVEAAGLVRVSPEAWKETLRSQGVEARYDRWKATQHKTASPVTKEMLWDYLPVVILLIVLTVGIAFCFLLQTYLASLRECCRAISYRSQQYRIRDLSRS